MNVAALVLGILALVLSLIPSFSVTQMIGMVLGIVALILGVIGRKSASERGQPTGMGTAGLVLGIVALVLNALIFAACQYCNYKVSKGLQEGIDKVQNDPKFKREFREKLREAMEKAGEKQGK